MKTLIGCLFLILAMTVVCTAHGPSIPPDPWEGVALKEVSMEGMTLTQAISGVETAFTNLGTADANQANAQTRYDAAAMAKGTADTDDVAAVGAFNEALDTLIASATAAKVVRQLGTL